jgi:hypothetical protein
MVVVIMIIMIDDYEDSGVDGSDAIAGDGRLWRCCLNPGSKSKGLQEAAETKQDTGG